MSLQAFLLPSPRRSPYSYALLMLVVLYAAILSAPRLLFAGTISAGAITLHTHTAKPALASVLNQAKVLLSHSTIDDPALAQDIYLTSTPAEFTFFSNLNHRAFGVTYPVSRNTFLAPSDPTHNLIQADSPTYNTTSLTHALAHERTHALLEHHFGVLHILLTPTWKQEGYCDYIGGSHSIGTKAEGLALLRARAPNSASPMPRSLSYFQDYLRVRYLLEIKHLTVDQIFTQSFDTPALDREALAAATTAP